MERTNEGSRIRNKANYGGFRENAPFLTHPEKIRNIAGGLAHLPCTLFPKSRWNVVLVWRKQWWIERALRFAATDGDEWNILSVKYDIA